MMEVKFLELGKVNAIILDEIKAAIDDVLNSGWYILGHKLKSFEENFVRDLQMEEKGFCVGCNSGTDAISLALLANGIVAGDEVITVSHTAIPTVSAIVAIGAKPVFVDIDSTTWVMDIMQVSAKITQATKAIVCVHLYGNMVDIIKLKEILREIGRTDIIIIEDVAQAHGAVLQGSKAGTLGHAGTYSFYPSKNIGALGDGGAVFTQDKDVYEKLLMYRNYGQKDRYHALICGGINSRLDEMQAAILNVKLKYLNGWNQQKQELMKIYQDELKDCPVTFQKTTNQCIPAWHLCVIRLNENIDRDVFMEKLQNNGIQTLIHYPYPVHTQEGFQKYGQVTLKNTENLVGQIVSLPFSYIMEESEIKYISSVVKKIFSEIRNKDI